MQAARTITNIDQVNAVRKQNPYQVVKVEKIDTPDGMDGNNWYRYVIDYGQSTIEGKKPGTLKLVKEHAQSVVDELNSRSFGNGGFSSYASRNKRSSIQTPNAKQAS